MTPARPRTVTLACVYAGLGASIVLLYLLSVLSNWGSLELQEQWESALESEALVSAGMSVDSIMDVLWWILTAMVVASISAVVFAIYAAKGHRASRIGLTVLCSAAALLFVSAGLVGILPAVLALGCVAMLWSRDARAFYAVGGQPPVQLGAEPAVPAAAGEASPVVPAPPAGQLPPSGASALPVPGQRPASVMVAVAVTGIGSLVAAGGALLMLLVTTVLREDYRAVLAEPGFARDVIEASGMTADDVIEIALVLSVVWLIASVAGLVAASFALRSGPTGRLLLTATSVVTLVLGVVAIPLGVVWIGAAIAVLVLVNRPDAKAWFSRR